MLSDSTSKEQVNTLVDALLAPKPQMELPPFGFYKARIIFLRSLFSLLARKKMLFGGLVLQVFTAAMFGWVLGSKTEGQIYNTTTFFAVVVLVSLLSNIQFVFFLFKSQQVFLKESRRGLTHGLVQWVVSSIPMYVFRVILAVVNGLIAYIMIGLKDDRYALHSIFSVLQNNTGDTMDQVLSLCVTSLFFTTVIDGHFLSWTSYA